MQRNPLSATGRTDVRGQVSCAAGETSLVDQGGLRRTCRNRRAESHAEGVRQDEVRILDLFHAVRWDDDAVVRQSAQPAAGPEGEVYALIGDGNRT